MIAPKKKIVGTAKPWIANQRNVKIGYVITSADFLVVIMNSFLIGKIETIKGFYRNNKQNEICLFFFSQV